MAGMTATIDTDAPVGDASDLFARAPVKAVTWETALRRVRAATQGLRWAAACAAGTRHYKSAGRVHQGPPSLAAYTAWVHALEASPWVIPQPEWLGLVTLAYSAYEDHAHPPLAPGLSLGAAELAAERGASVVHLHSPERVRAWLQRVGPCVVEGGWSPLMNGVRRDTETIGPWEATGLLNVPHAVALVGVRPDAVRLVNNRGPSWGALGRAWMENETLAALLADGGEAWGALPADLTPKKGGR
jgi:hypothetical protein